MFTFFYLLTSILCAASAAIILETKRHEWPVRNLSINLRRFLQRRVHRKMHRMPKCSICLAFWTALVADIFVCVNSGFVYWLWPMSGFAAAGFVWLLYTLLNHFIPVESPAEPSQTEAYDPSSLSRLMDEAHQSESSVWDGGEWSVFYAGETEGINDTIREIAQVPPGSAVDMEEAKDRVIRHLRNTHYAYEASTAPKGDPALDWDAEVERMREEQARFSGGQ